MDYDERAQLFKALSDSNRLKILNMLAGGELCACDILEQLNITQPTLSHHMKILCATGLVSCRKDSKWSWYSANPEVLESLDKFVNNLMDHTSDCFCN